MSLDEKTGRIVSNKVTALLDHGIKPIYMMRTESGKTINTTAEHPYFVKLYNKKECDEYAGDIWNKEYDKFNEEKGCTRWVRVDELDEGNEIAINGMKDYKALSISLGDSTLIDETCNSFFNTLSPEKIGQFNFNANAKYCTSFKCSDNKCFACSKQSSNCERGTNVICSNINSRASSNSSLDSFDLLKNSCLCFPNSDKRNSGATNSNLLNIKLNLNTLDESPFPNKEESITFTSTTDNIFNYSEEFKYLFDNAVFILSVNSSTSSSVSCDFDTILWNRITLSNLDLSNLLTNMDQSILCTCLIEINSSGIFIFSSSMLNDNKPDYLSLAVDEALRTY